MATGNDGGSVRSLQRGLEVLEEINRSAGIRAGTIARNLGLPRPTVYRLLDTLEALGFVSRSVSDERFYVTVRARALGNGPSGGVRLGDAAGPILVELGRQLVWPVDLVVCEAGAMVIQESTHSRSPLSIDRGMVGIRLPMLRTAAGRAYLAFSAEPVSKTLIDYLRKLGDPADADLLEPGNLRRMLTETRQRGFGFRVRGKAIPKASSEKTSSIAVPIMLDSSVVGCIVIIWIASAVTLDAAVRQFLPPMKEAARSVAAEMESRMRASSTLRS